MGRPINHKYFGDQNPNATQQSEQTGGEGVASVAVTGTFSGKTPGTYTIPASVISAPQIAGGKKATMTLTYLTDSTATVAVVSPGTGYTGTTTISGAALQALGGAGTGTIVLTATMTATSVKNALAVQARYSGSNATSGNDIVRQVGSKRFVVNTAAGQRVFTLVTRTPAAAGEMAILATDQGGATYWVSKLYNRTCRLVNVSGTPEFADGVKVKWNFTASTANAVVSLANA